MPSFTDILNQQSADIKPPRPLPMGNYLAIIDGPCEIKKIGKEQTDAAVMKFKFVQPQGDVNQQELLEVLDGKSLSEVPFNVNWWLTQKAAYRLNDFLVNACGMEQGTRSLGELLSAAPGSQVIITISHRPSDDGKTMYMDAKGFARV